MGVDEEVLGLGVGIEAPQVFGQPRRPTLLVGAARVVEEERVAAAESLVGRGSASRAESSIDVATYPTNESTKVAVNHTTILVKIDRTRIFMARLLMFADLGAEQVADAADGADQAPQRAQLLPQVADVDVERAILGRDGTPVDRRGHLVAGDDPARRAEHQLEDVELGRRDLDGAALAPDLARARHQPDAVDFECFRGRPPRAGRCGAARRGSARSAPRARTAWAGNRRRRHPARRCDPPGTSAPSA